MDFYNWDMRSSVIRIIQMPSLKHALMFSHQLKEFSKKREWLSDLMVIVITDWNFDTLRERAYSSTNIVM